MSVIKQAKLELIYGKETAAKIINSNVLVVGAGGIGCELMKTLSVTGFIKITIIDLDTIDVSNLNRQFLFRREHVDMSKAQVLRDQIQKQNPHIQIQHYIGRIQEERFGYKFFIQFDIVINALDNIEARNHVNQMCFNLNIPLVEAGTNGYDATCISMAKNQTPCYQCVDQVKDQAFPVCTIRQKPEKLIHCIIWAKFLFEGLFGPKNQSEDYVSEEMNNLKPLNSSVNDQKNKLVDHAGPTSQTTIDNLLLHAIDIFTKVFDIEVESQVSKLKLKITSAQSNLNLHEKESEEQFLMKVKSLKFEHYMEFIKKSLSDQDYKLNNRELYDENMIIVLSLQEQIYTFIKSIISIYENRQQLVGTMVFDKDDELIIDFVSAATNLRAYNFSINMESKFKIKEMAGKIIPAISSSNALVANLQVFEAVKLLSKEFEKLRGIYYRRQDPKRLQSYRRLNDERNPNCKVCSNDHQHIYFVEIKSLQEFTFGEFIQKVLVQDIKLDEEIQIDYNNKIVYDYYEDCDDFQEKQNKANVLKTFEQLDIKDCSVISVQAAFLQDPDGVEGQTHTFMIQVMSGLNLNQSSIDSDQALTHLTHKIKQGVRKSQAVIDANAAKLKEIQQLKKAALAKDGNSLVISDDELEMDDQPLPTNSLTAYKQARNSNQSRVSEQNPYSARVSSAMQQIEDRSETQLQTEAQNDGNLLGRRSQRQEDIEMLEDAKSDTQKTVERSSSAVGGNENGNVGDGEQIDVDSIKQLESPSKRQRIE
eukprot:403371592